MLCGNNYHGGAQQQGCGKSLNWSQAPPYRAAILEHSLPQMSVDRALLSGAGCRHLFTRCAVCTDIVRGPRFRCIHCESFDLCMTCVALLVSNFPSPHQKDHVFEILYAPGEPP